jgi:hypothetical protein
MAFSCETLKKISELSQRKRYENADNEAKIITNIIILSRSLFKESD